jgi:hypothetical protein
MLLPLYLRGRAPSFLSSGSVSVYVDPMRVDAMAREEYVFTIESKTAALP